MSNITIKDVAKRSGVGVGTVSRVLNNSEQVNEETRNKVLKAIEELNYVPNIAGKRLSRNRSYVIAVLVPVINHPFFAKLIEELEKAADEKGYSLLVASSQRRIEKEHEILKRLRQNEADGAVFVTHYQHDPKEFENLAIVTIDRHLGDSIPVVTSSNYEGTKQGVAHLHEKGCKKIAFIGSKPNQESEVSQRLEAYLDYCKENKLEPIVIYEEVKHGEEEKIIHELLAEHPDVDGVFVSGCIMCYNLLNILGDKNINVPNDIQVVSYDGQFAIDHLTRITTIEQPLKEMAKECVDLLIKLIDKEEIENKIHKFDCRFVKGNTTK